MAERPQVLGNREIIKLVGGLRDLDGFSNEAQKIERYDFDENLSWNIAKCRHILERAMELYDKEKSKLAARLGIVDKMKLTEENAPKVAEFVEKNDSLLDKTQEISGLLKLSRKELSKAGVKIPGVFVALMPILSD